MGNLFSQFKSRDGNLRLFPTPPEKDEIPLLAFIKDEKDEEEHRNFYRRFIRNFSDIAQPLNELLKKDRKFTWTPECQSSFDEMKKRFTEELVLAMPDHSQPFQIETDASKYATGAVLSQLDSNGD